MANIFDISPVTEDIKADAQGKGSAVFTVTNRSSRPIRGTARARALGNTKQEWLNVEGETERDFSVGGTQQFTVSFNKPPDPAGPAGAPAPPAEKFPFRLDVSSVDNPDEQFTEGPTVNVEVKAMTQEQKKSFPWWILIVIGVILLIAIILIIIFAARGCTSAPPAPGPGPTTSPTVAPGTVVEVYNFYDRAESALWVNDNRELINFGADHEPRGTAIKRPNTWPLETGRGEEKVMETHPRYVNANGGKTTGTYQLTEPIRAGDKFRTKLGFYKDAVGGDLRVRLLLNGVVINELPKKYDGSLREWVVDLSDYAGQSGNMSLEAWGVPTNQWGWICWINPRIDRVAR